MTAGNRVIENGCATELVTIIANSVAFGDVSPYETTMVGGVIHMRCGAASDCDSVSVSVELKSGLLKMDAAREYPAPPQVTPG